MRRRCSLRWWQPRRLALVAFGKEAKSVNLPDEIGHTSPSSEPKSNHKYPYHNEGIYDIHCSPAWHEEGRLLCSILKNTHQFKQTNQLKTSKCFFSSNTQCSNVFFYAFRTQNIFSIVLIILEQLFVYFFLLVWSVLMTSTTENILNR